MFKIYYHLSKPGIIYGNAMTAIAGFFLASKGNFDLKIFLGMLIGISLVIASGCVFNNIIDKDIDGKMERTKNRAMVIGAISKSKAIIFGTVIGILGVLSLFLFTNHYALLTALLGFVVYVFLYTPIKRRSIYATEVGSVAGAAPIVVGYISVANKLDVGALILFLILVFWQMPHFYAISIRRLKEYKAAGIPVLPAINGIHTAKIRMLVYIVLFIAASCSLTYFKYTGLTYLTVMVLLGLFWLWRGVKGFKIEADDVWAKKIFLFSLTVLTIFSAIVSFGRFLI